MDVFTYRDWLAQSLHIVIEAAGAQRGALVQNQAGCLTVQAKAEVGAERVITLHDIPLEESGAVPISVVNYTARTQTPVVLEDAFRDSPYTDDPYVAAHQIQSLLCLPTVHQGKLSGLLYLENNLATGVFTSDRLEVLKALASQAAISIENASLYANLEKELAELKQAEGAIREQARELQRSEAYLSEAQRLTHTGSWALRPGMGKPVYWSEEMFRIWSFDPQQGPPDNETAWQRIHPEDLTAIVQERIERTSSGKWKTDIEQDHRIVLPDGIGKYIHSTSHPVFDDTGKVIEYVGTSVDVTERKRAEEELRAAETYFRAFVDHATDAFFVHDEQHKIIDVNRQACESLGYTREELIGMAPHDFDPRVDAAFMQWIDRQVEAGETLAFETSHR